MSEASPHSDEPRHASVQYEPTDLSFRSVIVFFGGLAIGLVMVGAGSWGLVLYLTSREDERKRSDSPWTMEVKNTAPSIDRSRETRLEETGGEQSRLPSLPRLEGLEINAGRTIQEQNRQEDEYLGDYGWVDRKARVVHIPIDEAMKKVAGQLPARDGKDVNEFLEAPSRASSGRVPRGGE